MKARITLRTDRTLANGNHAIIVIVTHQQKRVKFTTKYFVAKKHWKNNNLATTHPDYARLNYKLSNLQNLINLALYEASVSSWTINQVAEYIKNDGKISVGSNDLYEFTNEYMKNLTEGNRKVYQETYNMLKKYQANINFSEITTFWVRNYKEYLQYKYRDRRGNSIKLTTVRKHLRTLRSIYLKALEQRTKIGPYDKSNHPFLGQVPSKIISVNKALTIDELKSIFECDLYVIGSRRWKALQLFKFHFLVRGLDTIDIARLKKNELSKDNRIYLETRYKNRNRESTAPPLSIKLFPQALEIWNYFLNDKKNDSKYTFDLMLNFSARRNNYLIELRKIKKDLNIESAFSFKVTRYTFATIGSSKGMSSKEIGQLLGHAQGSNVTDGYIQDLSNSEIDKFHELIISTVV